MTKIGIESTKKISSLSRIKCSEKELENYTKQINEILEYMDKLNNLDTKGILPMYFPNDIKTPIRQDNVEESDKDILRSSPSTLYDGYKVPPVI